MKIKLALVCAIAILGSHASAYTLSYDKGYSSATVSGVTCTSGTAVEITGSMAGFNVGAYRLINQDSADEVYIGFSNAVSSDTASGFLGEKLASGASGVWELGWNPDTSAAVKLWCRAADAAGVAGARLSRAIFGYR